MQRIIQVTTDGSHTIAIPEMDVSYHSKHGAIQESMHVFIEAGLHDVSIKSLSQVNILEIGFGTGLNALLTAIEAEKIQQKNVYTSIEAYPLTKEEYNQLNYGTLLNQQLLFNAIHEAAWDEPVDINPYFNLQKIKYSITPIPFKLSRSAQKDPINFINNINLIYFDAFAPTAQPELWTIEVFNYLFSLLSEHGILVTYCSKGSVRRTMEAAGFTVEKIPGPPGKREMVRGERR
jgi:tRNA U34 5-methylaminomethyl-2-thiouridine-forming methyltransferase MnmC